MRRCLENNGIPVGRRIWQRLRDEYGATAAESTVRHYVARMRRELQPAVQPVFLDLVFDPAEAAQVDWASAGHPGWPIRDRPDVLYAIGLQRRVLCSTVPAPTHGGFPGGPRGGLRILRLCPAAHHL